MPPRIALSRRWWELRWVAVATVVAFAIPLLSPVIPPLIDLPGHMARYRLEAKHLDAPWLDDWYRTHWAIVGNLGVDLLVAPLADIIGIELATKFVVLAIPMLFVAGVLWLSREIHGRIVPTAFFALPLAYNYAFQFGFVNFVLSMALAFNAFAFWLRLERVDKVQTRSILFVPIGVAVWVCHVYGWAVLCILVAANEFIHLASRHFRWHQILIKTCIRCLPLVPPIFLMITWRSGGGGVTNGWFDWKDKALRSAMALRDRWELFDLASLGFLLLLVLVAAGSRKMRIAASPGFGAMLLAAAFLLLPSALFGSAFADTRLPSYVLAMAIVAIRPADHMSSRTSAIIAALGLSFCLLRLGAQTYSYGLYDGSYRDELVALNSIPVGSRLVSFVGESCEPDWTNSRLDHLPGIAVVRRAAFSNDQWLMAGAQISSPNYKAAGDFGHNPSQIRISAGCPSPRWASIDDALSQFPRDAFDYVWLIQPPKYNKKLTSDLEMVWHSRGSVVFRVKHADTLKTTSFKQLE